MYIIDWWYFINFHVLMRNFDYYMYSNRYINTNYIQVFDKLFLFPKKIYLDFFKIFNPHVCIWSHNRKYILRKISRMKIFHYFALLLIRIIWSSFAHLLIYLYNTNTSRINKETPHFDFPISQKCAIFSKLQH